MRTARFFVPGAHEPGERVRIEGGDAHHLRDVLRLRSGDAIDVIDSAGRAFVARIEEDPEPWVRLVEERSGDARNAVRVDVAQALPKGVKMDLVVEKATELGAHAILPFTSERTIPRRTSDEKRLRWNRIARSAAEQSGRREIPAVLEPIGYDALLERFGEYDLVLYAWESSDASPFRERLPALLRGARRVLVVIGPEGGFSHAEAQAARERGAEIVSLGPRILRTETAALVVLAIIAYESDAERSRVPERRIKED